MPQIFDFYCSDPDCEFEMPSGWGYYMYAIADDGERVHCPHPGEMGRAREVIGEDASREEIDRRTGFNGAPFAANARRIPTSPVCRASRHKRAVGVPSRAHQARPHRRSRARPATAHPRLHADQLS